MASKDQTTLLVKDVSLVRLVESSGVKLVRVGNKRKGHCPFHSDTSQSLVVNPDQNHWHCSTCDTGGSAVEWVKKYEGISKSHANELLRNNYQPGSLSSNAPIQYSSTRRLDAPFDVQSDDQQILRHVVNHYHETLKRSPDVLAYLKKRGINNSDVIEYFKLGFSDRTLGYRLPDKNRKDGAALRGRLHRLGIIKPSGHELFHGSLVIPIIENGVVQQVYGHKITRDLRAGSSRECFLPGTMTGFFHPKAVQICEELIICSSIMDALTFWCAGYKNVTCSYGMESANE